MTTVPEFVMTVKLRMLFAVDLAVAGDDYLFSRYANVWARRLPGDVPGDRDRRLRTQGPSS